MSIQSIKNLRDGRVAAGLCREGCGRPVVLNRTCCQECLDKRYNNRNKYVLAGLCRDGCGRPAIYGGTRCRQCLDAISIAAKNLLYNDFLAACDHYGGRLCANCGETNLKFLTVDHMLGGGMAHARRIGQSTNSGVTRLPQWLRNHDYPVGYQILCWNDNLGKSRNGNALIGPNTFYVCDCITKRYSLCVHGLTYDQRYSRRLVVAAINAYGGPRCVCCGETNQFYLTLDHEFNDGAVHRVEITSNIYKWTKNRGYPQDVGLRVMCANCNCGRQYNGGVCPHQS